MKMTSAYANKMLRKLAEDKEYWRSYEAERSTYVASVDEEPVVPEYDYQEVAQALAEIDRQVAVLKHAINLTNVTNTIEVDGEALSIDSVLVRMAQLNARKSVLDMMRKHQPKSRAMRSRYSDGRPEYCYINYDLAVVKKEYEAVDKKIAQMQMALDHFNQTFEFDVDL